MPYILGALIAAGLGVAAFGRRWPLVGWAVTLVGAGAAGLYDYWKWGYDYGHNLAEDAIIKIPGMSYQPPLIGPKQLLNFTATSWPDFGGIALVVAGMIVAVALWLSFRRPSSAAAVVAPPGATA